MAVKLSDIIPFGRSLGEYRAFFALSANDQRSKIIGVGDGPASFNAEMASLNHPIVSVDPLYTYSTRELTTRFDQVAPDIMRQILQSPEDWVWTHHRSAEALIEHRIKVFNVFAEDYESGKRSGRYRVGELPQLDFDSHEFDLALCSHLLFLYSDQLSYDFHLKSIREMLRIAKQVRLFPLLTLAGEPSPYVSDIIDTLNAQGYCATIERVDYELQKGGNQMLKISKQ